MSQPIVESFPEAAAAPAEPVRATADPTDVPIPFWPEGVLASAAAVTLVVIGLRHRAYLKRKARELQRTVDEFQRHGGLDEISQVVKQAGEFIRGATG